MASSSATEKEWLVTKYIYRPQRSCGKVMFLHVSVILSTGMGAGLPLFQADKIP